MPEGPTLHFLAARHRALFARDVVTASSPQGRFADGAARIDGRELEDVAACGKHLFYDFGDDVILHVHLGLHGRFFEHAAEQPPAPSARLRMEGSRAIVELVGPMTCEIVDAAERRRIEASLGPDPLRLVERGELVDGARFYDDAYATIARSDKPIAALLLDQKLFNGVGNEVRAEAMHAAGVDPRAPGRALGRATYDALARALVDVMKSSARDGVVAVRPPTGDPKDLAARRAVYQRERCADCGGPVSSEDVAGRTAWWCPSCQRAPAAPARRPTPHRDDAAARTRRPRARR